MGGLFPPFFQRQPGGWALCLCGNWSVNEARAASHGRREERREKEVLPFDRELFRLLYKSGVLVFLAKLSSLCRIPYKRSLIFSRFE